MATGNGNISLPNLQLDDEEPEFHVENRLLQSCTQNRRRPSVKALHCHKKRTTFPGAKAVFFTKPITLSALYIPRLSPYYINQVFWVKERIGAGSFGDVFKAISKENNGLYAIKISNNNHPSFDIREVERWEKVPVHINCVKFYMAWQETHHLYMQMEYCLTSLDKFALISGHLSEANTWDVCLDVLLGLKHLHDHNLIHMDIKPANIMVNADGVYKLGDFGLVIEYNEANMAEMERNPCFVSEGDSKYVSMEVLRYGIVTVAGDMFSLGIMMLELISRMELPSRGFCWDRLRFGLSPEQFGDQVVSKEMTSLITRMMCPFHERRPTATDALKYRKFSALMEERSQGKRINYVAKWLTKIEAYHKTLNREYILSGEDSPHEYEMDQSEPPEETETRPVPLRGPRKLF